MKYTHILLILSAIYLTSLTGCGGKGLKIEVETSGIGDGAEKHVTLSTDYQIENGFTMKRNIKTGEYDIELGSATTKDAEMGFMVQMMQLLMSVIAPGGVSVIAPPTELTGGEQ